jgi:dynein heavy chain
MGEVEGLEAGQEAGGQEGAGLASSASSTDGEPVGDTDKGAAACRELLARLPSRSFDLAEARLKYPVLRDTSMNSVLVQELQRFNALLELITSSAQGLLLTLNGEQLASEASEQLHASILLGEVPTCWLKASYPTQRTLAGFVADLRRRLALMRTWVDLGPPPVFWLPGLFSPQAFLTAVLQDHARRHALEIDRVCFGFDYREASAADAQDPCSSVWRDTFTAPSGGALVSGLSLEGAGWSASLKALEESAAGCLHSRLPLIHLKPKVREGTDDVDESVYRCPMYRTAARRGTLSTTGHSTNFVMYVDLPAGRHTAKHWTKRGAAILNDLAL